MSPDVSIDDLNLILELGTLHGKVEDFVCQTSNKGSQQIKIYSEEVYAKNSVNTALRIRARTIFSYVMQNWNPQTDHNFREKIKETYLETIYLFFAGTIELKAQYFLILQPATYKFVNRTTELIIYQGVIHPDQVMSYEETDKTQYWIDCYLSDQLFSSLQIRTVNNDFNIQEYYNNLFGL